MSSRRLREEREREIEAAYRRGYGEHPQEEWVGEVGLAAFADLVSSESNEAEAEEGPPRSSSTDACR
ncbi:MAG: hypothetical protein ICV64_08945 [Thermoleophilia bacterium]|nr:hypothetical protein [Thermoleophilia bacterium]